MVRLDQRKNMKRQKVFLKHQAPIHYGVVWGLRVKMTANSDII